MEILLRIKRNKRKRRYWVISRRFRRYRR